ncbi:MAG: translation elongation factor Ts [Anaerolineae bacterium]|jgi:elongation factor Ts|nr:translation elongation factor Ts [Anaerolineae bacterium]
MAEITAQMVKELREMTGAGPMDCKKALVETGGDMQKAADYLREKGIASAIKKLGKGRSMNEGLVEVYQHFNKRLGVMVEVNCETDFVAKTERFQQFTRDIAMHIVSAAPQYVRREDVPEAVIAAEREIQKNRAVEEGKKPEIAEKVAEGRMSKFFEEIVLLEQSFFKDDSKTIEQFIQEAVADLGESIQVRRFSRFALGDSATDGHE